MKIQIKPLVGLLLSISGMMSSVALASSLPAGNESNTQVQQLQQQVNDLEHELSHVEDQLSIIRHTNPPEASSSSQQTNQVQPKNVTPPVETSKSTNVSPTQQKNTTSPAASPTYKGSSTKTTQQKTTKEQTTTPTKKTAPAGNQNYFQQSSNATHPQKKGVVTAYEQDILKPAPGAPAGVPYGEFSLTHLGGFAVITSPYLHPNTAYDGGDFIVNYSSINKDANMLQQRQAFTKALHSLGFTYPNSGSLLELSGEVEAQAFGQKGFGDVTSSDINLPDVELDMQAIINRWVTAFANFVFNDAPTASGNRVFNSNVYVDNAFITLGDLNITQWRATVGQIYVPFGLFNSFLVSNPVNKTMFRTESRPLLIGYGVPGNLGFSGAAYTFVGGTRNGTIEPNPEGPTLTDGGTITPRALNDKINRWGLDGNYGFMMGKIKTNVGASFINNVADSQGMQATGFSSNFEGFNETSGAQVLAHTVPGADVRGQMMISRYTLIGEYTTATRDFNRVNLSFNGRGAKPSDYHLEGVYSFNLYDDKPTTFAFGYDHSYQALALNVPEQQIAAALNVSFVRNTIASLELRHQINYGSGDTATGNLGPIITPGGAVSNTITGQFAVYF